MSNNPEDYGLTFIPSVPQSEADRIGQQVDAELIKLSQRSASLFTAHELQYLSYWINKMRFFTTAEQEQPLLDEVLRFKDKIERRAARIADPAAMAIELESVKESLAEKMRMIDTFYEILKAQPQEIQDAVFGALSAKADSSD